MSRIVMQRLVAATALAVICACGGTADARSGSSGGDVSNEAFKPLQVGDTMPAYVATTLAGDTMKVTPGQPLTLVNIWATWCESCKEEMEDLQKIHDDYGKRGIRVLAVSVDQAPTAKVSRFIESIKTTFPVSHDRNAEIQQLYQAVGVPSTYLVSPDGRLLWKHTGGLHGAPEIARNAIEKALQ